MKEKRKADESLSRRLSIPQEAFGPAPRITLSGGSHVLVEGQRGLEEYEPDHVAVAVGRGRVVIRGQDLMLDAMNGTELSVSGKLWAVELE